MYSKESLKTKLCRLDQLLSWQHAMTYNSCFWSQSCQNPGSLLRPGHHQVDTQPTAAFIANTLAWPSLLQASEAFIKSELICNSFLNGAHLSDVRCNQMILSREENSYYTGPLWYSSSIDEACSVLDAGPENNLCNYNISHEPGKCLKQSAAKRCNEREREGGPD